MTRFLNSRGSLHGPVRPLLLRLILFLVFSSCEASPEPLFVPDGAVPADSHVESDSNLGIDSGDSNLRDGHLPQDAARDVSMTDVSVFDIGPPRDACTAMCGGQCTDLAFDINNCGECGNACTGDNVRCIESSCRCAAPLALCDATCSDLSSDDSNCGQCGRSCGDRQRCVDSECRCETPFQSCGGACRDVNVDEQNCGECGRTCLSSHECIEGQCTAL